MKKEALRWYVMFRSSLIGYMTLKLLPLLGAIGLQYAWVLPASIVRSSVVSPAKIKASSWVGQHRFYHLFDC